jgi:serine protease inhibitor
MSAIPSGSNLTVTKPSTSGSQPPQPQVSATSGVTVSYPAGSGGSGSSPAAVFAAAQPYLNSEPNHKTQHSAFHSYSTVSSTGAASDTTPSDSASAMSSAASATAVTSSAAFVAAQPWSIPTTPVPGKAPPAAAETTLTAAAPASTALGHLSLKGKTAVPNVVNYMYQLGGELIHRLSRQNPEASALVSPFSAMQALGMLANAMPAEALAKMGLAESDLKGLNESLGLISRAITKNLENALTDGYERSMLTSSNAMAMLEPGADKTVRNAVMHDYSGEVFALKGNQKQNAIMLAAWAASKVNDDEYRAQVQQMAESAFSNLSDDGVVLMNLLFLKARWELEFKDQFTTVEKFACLDGTRVDTNVLHHWYKKLRVAFRPHYTTVVLPFVKDNPTSTLNYVCIIPNNPAGMHGLTEQIPQILNEALNSQREYITDLHLPKQNFKFDIDILEILKHLGYPMDAVLSKLTGGRVEKLQQHLEGGLDEKGVKVVAVTFIKEAKGFSLTPPPSFVVDARRPHIGMIVASSGGHHVPLLEVFNRDGTFLDRTGLRADTQLQSAAAEADTKVASATPAIQQMPYSVTNYSLEAIRKKYASRLDCLLALANVKDKEPVCRGFMTDKNTELMTVNYSRHSILFNQYRQPLLDGNYIAGFNKQTNQVVPLDYNPDDCLTVYFEIQGKLYAIDHDLNAENPGQVMVEYRLNAASGFWESISHSIDELNAINKA